MSDPMKSLSGMTRLRNYFLTGVVVCAPLAITAYLVWSLIVWVDSWVKPYIPSSYNPDNYLPFAVPGFGLGEDEEHRRPRHVGAGAWLAPWQRVQAVGNRQLHEPMPGRMKLDLVDALAVAVVGAQHRRKGVGLDAPVDRLPSGDGAELADAVERPPAALALQRVGEGVIALERVVAAQRRRLIEHFVGCHAAS